VKLEAQPIFVRDARNTAEAISGFHFSIRYTEPRTNDEEVWLSHEFVGNVPGTVEDFGPFINRLGTGFLIELHIHSTATEARLEFQLATDGIVARPAKPQRKTGADVRRPAPPPGFTLVYGTLLIKGVSVAKRIYAIYSNVAMAIDLVKFASAAVAPAEFFVGLAIGEVEGQVVALIPEDYKGLVGYRCLRCGHRGALSNFLGCKQLVCEHCLRNSATICFRSIGLDVSVDS